MVFAGPPAGWTVKPAPPESREAPQPAAGYLSVGVACDSVEALMKRTLTRNLEVRVSRADGVPVDFGFGGPPRSGCELKASGKFDRTPADSAPRPTQTQDEASTLGEGFKRAGWVSLPNYQADGPDGEDEGWRSKETTCVARLSWDGGDDGDSTYVPSDNWALDVGCAPLEPADLPRD
jgi:hypothetical protein